MLSLAQVGEEICMNATLGLVESLDGPEVSWKCVTIHPAKLPQGFRFAGGPRLSMHD